MSKIVCDVCGSSYSDTEAQCPICGTAKSDAVKPVVETTMEEQAKSGKYSKTGNKKSNAPATRQTEHGKASDKRKQEAPSNMAMIIIVAVLLIAIVAVCVFIAVRVMDNQPDDPQTSTDNNTSSTVDTQVKVPCTGIELLDNENKTLSFTKLTESAQLTVKALPENTTDKVTCTYTSSDPSVVQVDKKGLVTPKATGEATITIAYKTFEIKVEVTCKIPGTGPKLELTKEGDIKLSPTNGTSYDLYNLIKNKEKFDKDQFVCTSADEGVVRVEGTKVFAVSNNSKGVIVTIQYGDQSVECKVRVENVKETKYHLNVTDTTLTLGKEGYDKFELKLVDKDGNVIKDVEWKFSNDFPKCCDKVIDTETGVVTITAKAVTSTLTNGTYVKVYTTYEGTKYECIIRVNTEATQG